MFRVAVSVAGRMAAPLAGGRTKAPLARAVGRHSLSSRATAAAAVRDSAAALAASKALPPWPAVLEYGCDDRIVLAPAVKGGPAVNKYFCGVEPLGAGHVFRGSVTCNTPTPLGFAAAEAAYRALADGSVAHGAYMEELRGRIASVLGLEAGSAVFLSPSGSDAEYFPLLFARALAGAAGADRALLNIVACDGEIGRGSLPAAGGLLHAAYAPMAHQWSAHGGLEAEGEAEADADAAPKPFVGQRLSGLADGVRTVAIASRAGPEGEPVDPTAGIAAALAEDAAEIPVVHVVAGSKTGLWHTMPDADVLAQVRARGGLLCVDACQMRLDEADVAAWLAEDAVVLVTASKFFRAPPFCAAVLVSPRMAARLSAALEAAGEQASHVGARVPAGLRAFLTAHELPAALAGLDGWREDLSDERNVGLAVRWAAGLAEMEATFAMPVEDRVRLRAAWRGGVVDTVEAVGAGLVEACFGDSDGTMTDVSVRLVNTSADAGAADTYLDADMLVNVHRWMAADLSPHLSAEQLAAVDGAGAGEETMRAAAAAPCFIGQPVAPGAGVPAVVRIALGSDTLRAMADDPAAVLADDALLVRKLALCAGHYAALSAVDGL